MLLPAGKHGVQTSSELSGCGRGSEQPAAREDTKDAPKYVRRILVQNGHISVYLISGN